MTYLLASAARATIGARSGQEDAFRIWPAEGSVKPAGKTGLLAVLADGMGGHKGGAVAGETACATFTDVFAADDKPYEERLRLALDASNDALAKSAESNQALEGMGCTLIGAWFDDGGLRWTSVGDSLLLLYRFPDVIRLNEDHSLGGYLDEQARRNEITQSEARANPHRNALRSALMGDAIALVDLRGDPVELKAGDWILLASDGIASLPGDELADLIYRNRESTPQVMAATLIAAVEAKKVPEQDNTTVVAVRVEGMSERTTKIAPKTVKTARSQRIGVVTNAKVLRPATDSKSRRLAIVTVLATGLIAGGALAWMGSRHFFGTAPSSQTDVQAARAVGGASHEKADTPEAGPGPVPPPAVPGQQREALPSPNAVPVATPDMAPTPIQPDQHPAPTPSTPRAAPEAPRQEQAVPSVPAPGSAPSGTLASPSPAAVEKPSDPPPERHKKTVPKVSKSQHAPSPTAPKSAPSPTVTIKPETGPAPLSGNPNLMGF